MKTIPSSGRTKKLRYRAGNKRDRKKSERKNKSIKLNRGSLESTTCISSTQYGVLKKKT